jgi:hypothetical protein
MARPDQTRVDNLADWKLPQREVQAKEVSYGKVSRYLIELFYGGKDSHQERWFQMLNHILRKLQALWVAS